MTGLQVIWSLIENFTDLIVFLDPEKHDVGHQHYSCTMYDKGSYGHFKVLAAILDAILKITVFPMWDFGGTFSMLFLISNTTENRWKTFCSNLLGVRVFFPVNLLVYNTPLTKKELTTLYFNDSSNMVYPIDQNLLESYNGFVIATKSPKKQLFRNRDKVTGKTIV